MSILIIKFVIIISIWLLLLLLLLLGAPARGAFALAKATTGPPKATQMARCFAGTEKKSLL
jgi:hypothetical protein